MDKETEWNIFINKFGHPNTSHKSIPNKYFPDNLLYLKNIDRLDKDFCLSFYFDSKGDYKNTVYYKIV